MRWNSCTRSFKPVNRPGRVAANVMSLRRFGVATQLVAQAERLRQKVSLRDALARGGFRPYELGTADRN